MYTLKNTQLTVSILDPIADLPRLGSRYCSGGYIYQVTDSEKGELLAGPHYPDPNPVPFDGQGAPDMFFTPLSSGEVPLGGEAGCIGVGKVRRTNADHPFDVRFNPEVSEHVVLMAPLTFTLVMSSASSDYLKKQNEKFLQLPSLTKLVKK